MRARQDWARQQEETIARALAESQRLVAQLSGPDRQAALSQLRRQAQALHLAAAALHKAADAPDAYGRR
jgi:hypothetical protein